jgi:EpsI family protein
VGVTGELIGSSQASWVHDNGGLPVAALALGGLFLMARLLKCPLASPGSPLMMAAVGAVKPWRKLFPILIVLIGATALLAARLPTIQSEARADAQPAARLPLHLGQWEGTDEPVGADVQKALPTAHILSRRYQSPSGPADVTIVSGSDATALHDPHDCLAGEGWHFLKDQPLLVDVGAPGGPIPVRDVWMVKGSVQARMWYWYAVGPEIYNNTLRARLGLFRVRLVEGRGRRAEFVRLIVNSESGPEQTTAMLTDIARQVAATSPHPQAGTRPA